jgi:hypothetical protein
VLAGIVVAPVTRTVRTIPTEIQLGESEGLPVDCAGSDAAERCRERNGEAANREVQRPTSPSS